MATEQRLIYLGDAIERIVNFPSKVAHDAFYGRKQFTPMQMLTVIADRQHEVIDLLKTVKEVEARPVVHGHWIEHSHLEVGGECSVCGWQFQWFENAEARFCPHCGAKMDGGADNG